MCVLCCIVIFKTEQANLRSGAIDVVSLGMNIENNQDCKISSSNLNYDIKYQAQQK